MENKLKVLDLFSGIGGFSLGLERTGGFETVAFCEIEEFPRKVLKKHWPEVPCYEDVTKLTGDILRRDGISADIITGGFPCQDISVAGKQAGINEGTRSGLWSECIRLVGDIRPKFAIFENVSNLLSGPSEQPGGWFSRILGDLAEIGYDAEWEDIPAATVGAPHLRSRVWIVAYPQKKWPEQNVQVLQAEGLSWQLGGVLRRDGVFGVDNPPVSHVDDGIPDYMGGHFAAGNAVVPQIPELIGHAILEATNPQ